MDETLVKPVPAFTADASRLSSTPTIIEAPERDPLANFRSFVSSFQPDTTQLDQQRNQLTSNISSNLRSSGRAERFNELNDQFGVGEARADLAEIDEQIATLEGEFNRSLVDEEGRTIAGRFITGRQAQIVKQAQVQAQTLKALRAAKEGKLALAQQQVDRTLELEFADRQDELQADFFELEENAAEFERVTGKSKEELRLSLEERARVLDEEKDTRREILSLAQEAAANGADNATISAISQATDTAEATRLAGSFIGLQDRLNDQSNRATQALNRRKTLLDLAINGDPSAIEELGYDPAGVNGGIEGARQYEIQSADIQMGIDAAQSLLENTTGLQATTGAVKGTVASSIVDTVSDGFDLASIPGALAGQVVGVANIPQTSRDRQDFLSQTAFLINDVTFQEIRDLRAQGVTFGNMTEGERIAAGRAASQLASAAQIDASGAVTDIQGSEEVIRGYIEDLLRAYEGRQEYLDAQYSISSDEVDEARAIFETQHGSN